MILQALEDVIASKADTSDLLKERFGNRLDVILVEKAGHALLPEQPEIVSTAILDFLGRHRVR
jgi:pimeloyl-ACP methyl ester carboxylesterase